MISSIKPLSPDNPTPKPIESAKKNLVTAPKLEPPKLTSAAAKPKTPPPQNDSIPMQSSGISSGSFYRKKLTATVKTATNRKRGSTSIAPSSVPASKATTTPSPTKALRRSCRKSAKSAMRIIQKTLELAQYDFDENVSGAVELKRKQSTSDIAVPPKKPKQTKKLVEPPKWPVLNIETNKAKGKKEPRKLYPIGPNHHDMNEDKSRSKTPKPIKRVKSRESTTVELTSADFRESQYDDPMKAASRILENMMKINERAQKKAARALNPNASFSYRRTALQKQQRQADSTSPDLVSSPILISE